MALGKLRLCELIGLLVALTAFCRPCFAEGERPVMPIVPPTLFFYVAKGSPDSCGAGCNTWIAIEGQIEANVRVRFFEFMDRVGWNSKMPIILNSGGGSVPEAITIGRAARARGMITRVGRTNRSFCNPFAQPDCPPADPTIPREAQLDWYSGGCASACTLLFMSGINREIAPREKFGVHSMTPHSYVTKNGQTTDLGNDPDARRVAEAMKWQTTVLHRYLNEMGFGPEVVDLMNATQAPAINYIERADMYRFGFDPREAGNVPWAIVPGIPTVRYSAFQRTASQQPNFVTVELDFTCSTPGRLKVLYYAFHDDGKPEGNDIALDIDGRKLVFKPNSAAGRSNDNRSAEISQGTAASFVNAKNVALTPTTRSDEYPARIPVDMRGFNEAFAHLGKCPH